MNRLHILLISILTALSIAGLILTHAGLDEMKMREDGKTDAVYLPDRSFAKLMAMGFPEVWGNLYLLRAQVYWVDHVTDYKPEARETLRSLLDLATDLNPGDRYGYLFGSKGLSSSYGNFGHSYALDLLKKGWIHNPNSPDYPKNIGFEYYMYGDKPILAVPWFRSAAMVAGEDVNAEWMKDSLVWMVEKLLATGGASCEMTLAVLKDSFKDIKEDKQRESVIKQIQVQEILCQMENVAKRFHQEKGRWPDSLNELLAQTNLRSVENLPPDPFGGSYVLLSEGRVDTTSRLQRHGLNETGVEVSLEGKKEQDRNLEEIENNTSEGTNSPESPMKQQEESNQATPEVP